MPEKVSHDVLFSRLLEGKLLPGDAEQLVQWLGTGNLDPQAAGLILQQLQQSGQAEELHPEVISKLEARLPLIFAEEQQQTPVVSLFGQKWWRYAAVIILLLGTGAFFLLKNNQSAANTNEPIAQATPQDIQPGKDGAILTLEDGSTVVLDSMGNGLVTMQNGTKVMMKNGQLVYDAGQSPVTEVGYNTMATPKGRQFQLVLPDGSKVWLNAASSIRYPTVFTGTKREVQITGEAYFEVARNEAMPFRVRIDAETTVEVLGTHFNINSYDNEESVNTTLLEGSVQVKSKGGNLLLKPGQQAKYVLGNIIQLKNSVDIEKVMAWKNGVFNFEDASLQEVMRQLERWYDIDVVYEKNIPKLEFFGKMGKDLPLSAVLRGLEKSNVHFRVEDGKRLVVLP